MSMTALEKIWKETVPVVSSREDWHDFLLG